MRPLGRLPWLILAAFVALVLFGTALWVLNNPGLAQQDPVSFIENLWLTVVFSLYGVMGAFLAARRPENAVGWLFMAVSMFSGLGFSSENYAIYGLITRPGALPASELMAWFSFWTWVPGIGLLLTLTLLLFPTGRPPSPRWRPMAWLAGVVLGLSSVYLAFLPASHEVYPIIRNPVGIEALAAQPDILSIVLVLLTALAALSAASLVARFRSSGATERQQVKWFVYAGAVLVTALLVELAATLLAQLPGALLLTTVLFSLGLAAVPVAAGLAILRYRLWDIDVIISRTLLFTTLSASLAAVYVASVLLLQNVFRVLTGEARSELVTVVSTLVIAVLFAPVRRRLQQAIDRRFYRRQYDAARTLARFGERVRDETDLDRLSAQLVAAVDETLHPANVGLWVRKT